MKVVINIEKRHVYLISSLLVLFAGMFAVNAFGGTEPSVMGHSEGELDLGPITLSGDNVGIGVASPTQKLDVSGNIKSSNSIMAPKYCDQNGANCKTTSEMGGTLSCTTKSMSGSGTIKCPSGYTMTGGGSIWRSDGNDKYIYSYPNGNGWYCADKDGPQHSCYVRCCKL